MRREPCVKVVCCGGFFSCLAPFLLSYYCRAQAATEVRGGSEGRRGRTLRVGRREKEGFGKREREEDAQKERE